MTGSTRRHVRRADRWPILTPMQATALRSRPDQGAADCRGRLSARRGAGRTLTLARSRAASTSTRSLQSGRQPILALWHGRILRRAAPLPRSRHRRHHQPELRRRVDCRHPPRASASGRRADRPRAAARVRSCSCGAISRRAGRSAFTVDGPRGPARVAQPGAVWLAGATGHPILPFHIEADRFWEAASWDRTQVPEAVRHGGARDRPADRSCTGTDEPRRSSEKRQAAGAGAWRAREPRARTAR